MGMASIGVDLLYHRHAEPEIYYIAKGRGTTVLGHPGNQTTIDLREGTYFYIPGGMPHYTQAEPDQPLTVLYLFPRNNSQPIKYIYDDTTPLKTTSEKDLITINSISPLKAGRVFPTTIETLIKDVDLGFKRVVLSPNHDFTASVLSDDVILYINKGHTVIDLGPSDVHLQLKEGDYLYLSRGHTFSLKGEAPLGVEVFVFGRRFFL